MRMTFHAGSGTGVADVDDAAERANLIANLKFVT